MTVVAATKYVSLEEMAVLAEAGIEVVGENRAQDLEAKHARATATRFRWHFIGHLQSRKARTVNAHLRARATRSTRESAARRLEIPALVRGESLRRGDEVGRRPEASCEQFLAALRRRASG